MTETTPLRIAGATMTENTAERTRQAAERVAHLVERGHDGWHTLEHATSPADARSDEGPVADVRTSADILPAVVGSTA